MTDSILAAERERRMLTRDADTLEAAAKILSRARARSVRTRFAQWFAVGVLTGGARALRRKADDE